MKLPFIFAATLATLSFSVFADVVAESQFTTDADGWTIADYRRIDQHYEGTVVSSAVAYNATGGSPGGYISAFDPSGYIFTFNAPTKFLGNRSNAIGGQLNFSLTYSHNNAPDDNVVIIIGSVAGASRVIVATINPLPTINWSSYSIPLLPAVFRYDNKNGATVTSADFASIMSTIAVLRISGEFGTPIVETTRLDSVQLLAPTAGGAPNISIAMYPGITIQGVIGTTYRIDYTDDLANPNWIPLSTITLQTTPYLFTDSTGANLPRRFYRAVAL